MTLCTGELAKTKKPHFSLSPRQFVLQLVSAWENLHLNQIFSISQQFFGRFVNICRFLSDLPFGRCWGSFSSQLELNLLSTHYKGREQAIIAFFAWNSRTKTYISALLKTIFITWENLNSPLCKLPSLKCNFVSASELSGIPLRVV